MNGDFKMLQNVDRRWVSRGIVFLSLTSLAGRAPAQGRVEWSAKEAYDLISVDRARVIDVRTREEWHETGVGAGVWPVSMHEDRFSERLFAARELAGERDIGLICATGGRSSYLLRALLQAGFEGYFDISEGMLGSQKGRGWIESELPLVGVDLALKELPTELG